MSVRRRGRADPLVGDETNAASNRARITEIESKTKATKTAVRFIWMLVIGRRANHIGSANASGKGGMVADKNWTNRPGRLVRIRPHSIEV